MRSTMYRQTVLAAVMVMFATLLVPAAAAAPEDCPGFLGILQRIGGPCDTPDPLAPAPTAHGLGTVAGLVTETGTGDPIEGVSAFFTDSATLETFDEALTGSDGRYSIELPPGRYHILFAEETGGHVALMHDDTLRYTDSTPVVVVDDQTTTVDKAMSPDGGTISGTLTDSDGIPIEGAVALAVVEHPGFDLISLPKASLGVGETGADGSYTVRGLPTGDYWVVFSTLPSASWFGSDLYTADPIADGAALVSVTAPFDTPGIDGALEYGAGGVVLGSLYDGSDPVTGICVDAVPTANLAGSLGDSVTDDDGSFTIGALPEEPFYLRFEDCTRDVYLTEWYQNVQGDSPTGAEVITLTETELRVIITGVELRLTDVDDSLFRTDIIWLAGEGITRGCNTERTLFCPDSPVTRGQMAAFLVRALELTDQDPAIDFNDDNTSPFENDIEKLATAGITTGCGTNIFCPDNPVTRGQMAAFLVRALELTDQDPTIDFNDDNTSPFENDIEKLATAGITTGCGTNIFCPDNPVTRGQMAAFLRRGLEK